MVWERLTPAIPRGFTLPSCSVPSLHSGRKLSSQVRPEMAEAFQVGLNQNHFWGLTYRTTVVHFWGGKKGGRWLLRWTVMCSPLEAECTHSTPWLVAIVFLLTHGLSHRTGKGHRFLDLVIIKFSSLLDMCLQNILLFCLQQILPPFSSLPSSCPISTGNWP